MAKLIDLTGKKFGKLTVVSRGPKTKANKTTWYCVCACGKELDNAIATGTLNSGHAKSCGCAKAGCQIEDIVGNKYGHLTVLSFAGSTQHNHATWDCLCECGNKTAKPVLGIDLKRGHTASCGCFKKKQQMAHCNGMKAKAAESFLAKAEAAHGVGKYDYSEVLYTGDQGIVTVLCNGCGAKFPVAAGTHTAPKGKGSGCPSCASHGFNPLAATVFYYALLQLPNGLTAYMIGITNRTFEDRYSAADRAHMTLLDSVEFPIGADALALETQLKQANKHLLYTGEMPIKKGNTEVYVVDIEPFQEVLAAA